MADCDLCRGAGFVTYRDGIPYETHDVEREEHLIEDCPKCKGNAGPLKPPEANQPFERLDPEGRLVKIRHHLKLSEQTGYPVPAPWVKWLMETFVDPATSSVTSNNSGTTK